MAVHCERAAAQLFVAALNVEGEVPGAEIDALAALVVASEAALTNARETVQIHGGTGFTSDCEAHRLVKRAHVVDRMLGASATILTRLLDA
jgi:alkylation response protein AidB-like acyl-CoA dehydrogenase